MLQRSFALLAVLLGLATVSPAGSVWAAYKYQPFAEVPTASLTKNNFVSRLHDACIALAATPPIPAQHICPAIAAPPAASAELAQQIANARTLPGAAVAAGRACSAQAQADMNAVVGYVSKLERTCTKLRSGQPLATAPTDDDLKVLREARKAPEILETIKMWKANSAAGFPAALKGSEGKAAGGLAPLPVSLGSVSDQMIRGMAEFLVKRGQEESLRYLRDELKQKLCGGTKESDDVRRAAFSNVCGVLATLDSGMSLQAIGSYMRAAAERDVRKLPDLGLDYVEQRVAGAGDLAFLARAGLAGFEAMRRGRHPLEVLSSLGELARRGCEDDRCAGAAKAIRFGSALVYALLQGGEDWQDFHDPGTLAVKDRPVVAAAVVLLAEARLTALGPPRGLGFTVTAAQLNAILAEPSSVVADPVAIVRTWQALEKRLEDQALPIAERRDALAEAMVQAVGRFTRLVETSHRLLTGAADSPFASAMESNRVFVKVGASLARGEYGDAIVATVGQLREAAGDGLPPELTKYLPLLVEIATAQSSSEVAAAFDAYAAPLGTYKLKYKRAMVSINGFLGGHAGWERMSSGGVEGSSTILGGFAPMGIHASYPVRDWLHLGVLLSVLDLGAVTTAKLSDDDDLEGDLAGADPATNPKASTAARIGFAQVFSPGAYLVVGLGGTPFVAGAGISLSPELREVTQDGLRTEASVLRYGAFLAVDIPILPFQ